MDAKQKMAITGTGLMIAGVGLSLVGAALIAPAVIAWAGRVAEKSSSRLNAQLHDVSRTVGTVAGTLHRSFNQAAKAGAAEFKRSS